MSTVKFQAELNKLVETFALLPHPEGCFYKELYRSTQSIDAAALGDHFEWGRNYCTNIYFFLTTANFSGFHRIKQDEVWHFYVGHPLTFQVIDSEGKYTAHAVRFDLKNGIAPQFVVPAGPWFDSSINSAKGEATYSFVGCTVAQGFDFRDFELANRTSLIAAYPQAKEDHHSTHEGLRRWGQDSTKILIFPVWLLKEEKWEPI